MIIYRLLLILLATITTASSSSDHYLLSCGASSSVANTPSTYDGRTWHSDNNSTFSNHFSSTVAASTTSNAPQIPFLTARAFTANFTYSFPVSPGPKFIRLFFNPSTYSDAYLTLRTNTGHLLLRNFSAYLSNINSSYMFKEFYVHVNTSLLQLTFSPTPPSTRAFINGIEIVSVPESLYVGPTSPKMVAEIGREQFDLTNSTALETSYRLNVGGSEVASEEDSGSMYRLWENDEDYLFGTFQGITGLVDNQTLIKYTAATPNYSAPVMVYETFRSMGNINLSNEERRKLNVTWGFEVDLGFFYLLRLHWCEVVAGINASNYRVFDVYIDQLTADEAVDIFGWVGADTAAHRDYVVYMDGGNGSQSRGVLQLAMHPYIQSNPKYYDILLNGLEIFKLSRSDGSLDAPNPSTPFLDKPLPSSKSPSNIVQTVRVAIVNAFVIVVLLYEQMKIY